MDMHSTPSRPAPRPALDSLEIPKEDRGTSITRNEAAFLQDFLSARKPKATLEVGMGYGLSAAAILSVTDCIHHAMDPLQHEYRDLGLLNVERLGLSGRLVFHREYSHAVLPRLLAEGLRVDFAFIDGGHRFDEIFLDVYYAELLLDQGGHVVLHDAWMRSTATVASWIRRNKPNFRPVPTAERNLVVFRKEGADERPWNHFRGFGTWKSLWSHSLNTFKRRVKAAVKAA
jgi:predicted O-methyltransferase YrrM